MSRAFIALSFAALLLGPVAAHATIMTGSFSGTMTDGTDTSGVFGTSGADLSNDVLTGTFTLRHVPI